MLYTLEKRDTQSRSLYCLFWPWAKFDSCSRILSWTSPSILLLFYFNSNTTMMWFFYHFGFLQPWCDKKIHIIPNIYVFLSIFVFYILNFRYIKKTIYLFLFRRTLYREIGIPSYNRKMFDLAGNQFKNLYLISGKDFWIEKNILKNGYIRANKLKFYILVFRYKFWEWLNGTLFLKHLIFKIRCYHLIFCKNKVFLFPSPYFLRDGQK